MTDDIKDAALTRIFDHVPDTPADHSFTHRVGARIRRYRLRRSLVTLMLALISGVILASIVAPLFVQMINNGNLLLAVALCGCSLAGLGFTLIRAES